MEIELTDLAKKSLKDIAIYIEAYFSRNIAQKAMQRIHKHLQTLAFMPTIGKEMTGQMKGLRCWNYKQNQIIYKLLEDRIQIIIVWDGRQDPDRLLDLILEFFSNRYKEIKS